MTTLLVLALLSLGRPHYWAGNRLFSGAGTVAAPQLGVVEREMGSAETVARRASPGVQEDMVARKQSPGENFRGL
jgi:hypothetical protein